MKRIFVAINFPEKIRKSIGGRVAALQKLFQPEEMRFLSPENWHLTVSFLAYQDGHSVYLINETLKDLTKETAGFEIKFTKIVYGPPGRPRMIWLLGDKGTSQAIGSLKLLLEDKLDGAGVRFKRETRPYTAHVTLVRFEDISRPLPPIEQDLPLSFQATGIDLMESHLKRSGAEYEVLATHLFQAD